MDKYIQKAEMKKLVLTRIAVLQIFLKENATRNIRNIKQKGPEKLFNIYSENLDFLNVILQWGSNLIMSTMKELENNKKNPKNHYSIRDILKISKISKGSRQKLLHKQENIGSKLRAEGFKYGVIVELENFETNWLKLRAYHKTQVAKNKELFTKLSIINAERLDLLCLKNVIPLDLYENIQKSLTEAYNELIENL